MEQEGEIGCEKAQNSSAAVAVYLDVKQSCMLKCLERYQDNSLQQQVPECNEAISV